MHAMKISNNMHACNLSMLKKNPMSSFFSSLFLLPFHLSLFLLPLFSSFLFLTAPLTMSDGQVSLQQLKKNSSSEI